MRCGCPRCNTDSYMVHSERDNCCVCPECLYRCYACQGDGQALSREAILEAGKELLAQMGAEFVEMEDLSRLESLQKGEMSLFEE